MGWFYCDKCKKIVVGWREIVKQGNRIGLIKLKCCGKVLTKSEENKLLVRHKRVYFLGDGTELESVVSETKWVIRNKKI